MWNDVAASAAVAGGGGVGGARGAGTGGVGVGGRGVGGGGAKSAAMDPLQALRRKAFLEKPRKNRVVKYDVHPKLVNFCSPNGSIASHTNGAGWNVDELFANLFKSDTAPLS